MTAGEVNLFKQMNSNEASLRDVWSWPVSGMGEEARTSPLERPAQTPVREGDPEERKNDPVMRERGTNRE